MRELNIQRARKRLKRRSKICIHKWPNRWSKKRNFNISLPSLLSSSVASYINQNKNNNSHLETERERERNIKKLLYSLPTPPPTKLFIDTFVYEAISYPRGSMLVSSNAREESLNMVNNFCSSSLRKTCKESSTKIRCRNIVFFTENRSTNE